MARLEVPAEDERWVESRRSGWDWEWECCGFSSMGRKVGMFDGDAIV